MLRFAGYKQGPQQIKNVFYLSIDGQGRKEGRKEGRKQRMKGKKEWAEGRRQGQKRQKELDVDQSTKKQRSNTLTF